MITRFHSQPRITLLMLAMLTALAAVSLTDASAGEAHRILKPLGEAERATLHKLDARVSFELANATLADILAAITARTGVAIAQAPEALSDAAQQKRITIAADQVPGHVVLVETLAALGLGFDPTADGIVVNNKPRPGHMMLIESPDDGKKIERKIVKRLGPAPGGELEEDEIELEIDGPPTEEEGKRIIIRKLGSDDHEASPDGTIRRNVVLKMKENGVETAGKLKLEVRPN